MEKPSFGIYIHIPYCIQRCLYCDFATYEQSQIFPPQEYIQLLLEEMRQKSKYFKPQDDVLSVDTIYFGGGTPSLVPPELLGLVLKQLDELGFKRKPQTEITIEINPATVTIEKMKAYKSMGVNRYSVGAQTFKDSLLKKIGREHNAAQTLETLSLLRNQSENYNFDILFALPNQSLADLENDVSLAIEQSAHHISPYCLTIPKGHVLSPGRAPDEEQVEMFSLIRSKLLSRGYEQYEISNFSRPGFESRHNMLYWTDQNYWGLGLSAHSYLKNSGAWGRRFWNVSSIGEYKKQVLEFKNKTFSSPADQLPEQQFETLEEYQSLTDFCHTSLRLMAGLSLKDLGGKFGSAFNSLVEKRLISLQKRQLLNVENERWKLTSGGLLLSNLVFEEMTFLRSDKAAIQSQAR